MKCNKCKIEKDSSEFRIQSGGVGLAKVCISCDKSYAKDYHTKHQELSKLMLICVFMVYWKRITRNFFIEQQGKCAICKCVLVEPCVDHDHDTDAIRGLLCNDCNKGLGNFKDSLNILESAMNYLRVAPKKASLKTILAGMLWSKS